MNKHGLYAFYGTLRKGMENHSIYRDGMTYLQTVMLEGFRLYSLGEYPYAVTSPTGSIVADLFAVSNSHISQAIHAMEQEAGYHYREVVVDARAYGIYLFASPLEGDEEITSGDWVKFASEIGF